MSKWIYPFCLLLVLGLVIPAAAEAAEPIQLMVEGEGIEPDVPPMIAEGRTLVPLRVISENLGAKVTWLSETKKIEITKNGTMIELTPGSKRVTVNGRQGKMDVAPMVKNGRTLVPIRYISEWLGASVGWDDKNRTVIVSNPIRLIINGQALESPVLLIDGVPYIRLADTAGPFKYQLREKGETAFELLKQGIEEREAEKVLLMAWSNRIEKGTQTIITEHAPRMIDGFFMIPLPLAEDLFGVNPDWNPDEKEIKMNGHSAPLNVNHIESIELENDEVIVNTNGQYELNPQIFTLQAPHRIVVDLPDTLLGEKMAVEEMGTLSVDHPLIQSIRYSQFSQSPHTVRIVIDLKQRGEFDWEVKQSNRLVIHITPRPQEGLTVVIDAGHGAKDPGALGLFSREKDINLSVAKKVISLLEKDKKITVIPTRTDDSFLELADRVAVANEAEADLFVSIHTNSFPGNPKVRGTEIYYYTEMSRTFAEIMHRHIIQATGLADRGVKTARLYVVRHTNMPSVLVEMGFISNPEEEKLLNSPQFQDRIAQAIVDAIHEFQSGM